VGGYSSQEGNMRKLTVYGKILQNGGKLLFKKMAGTLFFKFSKWLP